MSRSSDHVIIDHLSRFYFFPLKYFSINIEFILRNICRKTRIYRYLLKCLEKAIINLIMVIMRENFGIF